MLARAASRVTGTFMPYACYIPGGSEGFVRLPLFVHGQEFATGFMGVRTDDLGSNLIPTRVIGDCVGNAKDFSVT